MRYLLPVLCFAPVVSAMQPMTEESMAAVSGQSGITIETTPGSADGLVLSTGEIRYTETDRDGQGSDYLGVSSLALYATRPDGLGGVVSDTIKTTIDITDTGDVRIKSTDINTLSLALGEISLSGRSVFSSVKMMDWSFVGNSYLETILVNDSAGSKIGLRTIMEAGSGLTYSFTEDAVTFSSDISFTPAQ